MLRGEKLFIEEKHVRAGQKYSQIFGGIAPIALIRGDLRHSDRVFVHLNPQELAYIGSGQWVLNDGVDLDEKCSDGIHSSSILKDRVGTWALFDLQNPRGLAMNIERRN